MPDGGKKTLSICILSCNFENVAAWISEEVRATPKKTSTRESTRKKHIRMDKRDLWRDTTMKRLMKRPVPPHHEETYEETRPHYILTLVQHPRTVHLVSPSCVSMLYRHLHQLQYNPHLTTSIQVFTPGIVSIYHRRRYTNIQKIHSFSSHIQNIQFVCMKNGKSRFLRDYKFPKKEY